MRYVQSKLFLKKLLNVLKIAQLQIFIFPN